ncbi:hypothetical protein CEUSTIGMA_g13247.t1 [Chlamydomonas eustigma]|uniref:Uncharacterized protein n=1 Tax=Chlamydomonas eustigma TaxID=1157962 RepID=A0A250XSC9_9CHLO|nr:hypothetical protein CEUSTIGMA_g13247.t1 [Chlamydomonas eustigma]|eukprot:GAX85832.1 hypothetical protein CEUSTIGMA_g13247.t1 [Chlamydomonas eustigma]
MLEARQDSFELLAMELDLLVGNAKGLPEVFPVLAPLPPTQEWQFNPHDQYLSNSDLRNHSNGSSSFEGYSDVSNSQLDANKQIGRRKSLTSPKGKSGKPSRWNRDKSKMGSLEQQQQEQQALADAAERENRQLRLRATAMEHILVARERQLSILHQYQRMCGPGSTMQNSKEAQEWHEAASASMTALATKLHEFVDEASLLFLQMSNNESRGDDAANEEIHSNISAKVLKICAVMGHAFTLNPAMQFQMSTFRMDMQSSGPPPEKGHWDRVARELKLEQDQVDEVAVCWEYNLSSMAKSQAELMTLRSELGDAAGRLKQLELQKILSTAMHNEGIAYRTLCFTLYGQIFTPIQMAKAIVHSFPYFPHACELMTSILGLEAPMIMTI